MCFTVIFQRRAFTVGEAVRVAQEAGLPEAKDFAYWNDNAANITSTINLRFNVGTSGRVDNMWYDKDSTGTCTLSIVFEQESHSSCNRLHLVGPSTAAPGGQGHAAKRRGGASAGCHPPFLGWVCTDKLIATT